MLDNFIDTFFILIFVIFVTAVATKELVDRNRSVQQELQANNPKRIRINPRQNQKT